MEMHTVYGICHNVIKLEEHNLKDGKRNLFVHRKGATRSFPDQPVFGAVLLPLGRHPFSDFRFREFLFRLYFGANKEKRFRI